EGHGQAVDVPRNGRGDLVEYVVQKFLAQLRPIAQSSRTVGLHDPELASQRRKQLFGREFVEVDPAWHRQYLPDHVGRYPTNDESGIGEPSDLFPIAQIELLQYTPEEIGLDLLFLEP